MRKNKSDKVKVCVSLSKPNLQYSMYQGLLLNPQKMLWTVERVHFTYNPELPFWTADFQGLPPPPFLWKSVVCIKSWEVALHELLTNAPAQQTAWFCSVLCFFFLRQLRLLFIGSAVENQLFFLHRMRHTGKQAYRFAVFVFLQKAHHWAAFLLESNLSVSAHSHSLLCKS